MPSMDLSFLIVDNMPPHALDEQIEARRNGVCIVTTIKQAEMWARCRLKLLSNPLVPFDETMQKCTALRMFDPKLVARFTFAVFTYGVSTRERYNPSIANVSPEDEEFLDAARTVLLWNLSTESTFKVPQNLWAKIMEYGRLLEESYGNEDIPLLLRANPYKLSILTYAFALLEGERQPTERHVHLAYLCLDNYAKDIELDEYTVQWRKMHQLTDEEYDTMKRTVEEKIQEEMEKHGGPTEDSTLYKFIEYVAKHARGQRDEIAAYSNNDPKTITQRANFLKGLQLLRSDKDGYHFTAKGVRFFKRWFTERMAPSMPSIPPLSEVRDHMKGENVDHNVDHIWGVTPKTGGIEGIKGTRECDVCGSPHGKLHLIPGKGERYICDKCLPDYEGDI